MSAKPTVEPIISSHKLSHGTQRTYVTGFVFSVYLTLTAFALVYYHLLSKWPLALVIGGLALIQFVVQLIYFLHLGRETRPRWKLTVFYFMLMVVVIVVFGSLWIMTNLAYRHNHHQTTEQQNQYLRSQDGL